jgi:hypothetical protein
LYIIDKFVHRLSFLSRATLISVHEAHATELLLLRQPGSAEILAAVPTAAALLHRVTPPMKSLLQFFLLIALVVVGKNVKDQARMAATPTKPVQQHVESMQSFFVQHVSYKDVPAGVNAGVIDYGRKTNPVSLN